MKSKLLIVTFFLLSNSKIFSQAKNTSNSKEFLYNVSIGSIIGAIGATLNKKPNQKLLKIAFKGFYQGALGGYITFESKKIVKIAEQNNDWKLLWCAKIINAAGTSIKENAASNKDFWEKWHINFGFNRIEFETKDKFSIKYKIMPIALVYTIGIATQSKFEVEKTLKSGEFIFSNNSDKFIEANALGVTYPGSIIIYSPYKDDFSVLSHEIIHIYQQNDFSQLETFLNRPLNYYNAKNKTFNMINKHIHYDFRNVFFPIAYNIEYNNVFYFYNNRFEREAAFFSNTFDSTILK